MTGIVPVARPASTVALLRVGPAGPQVLLTHPIGDFRDWAAIHDWAQAIAKALDAIAEASAGSGI